ncbi:MAG TPA: hypothetical protein VMV81_01610 [Phycisphaerae bacterium]|nr:hypothetical protein [Phycisphaerae bacterium]
MAETILSSLSETRTAKVKRWAYRLLLFIILPTAAIFGGIYVPWASFVPSNWLLSMQGDAKHWTTRELTNRLATGSLSKEQASRFINKVVVIDLSMRKVSPVVPFIPYRLCLHSDLTGSPLRVLNASATCNAVSIDGRENTRLGFSMSVPASGMSTVSSAFECPSFGKHLVEFKFDLTVLSGPGQSVCYNFERSIRASLTILDAPASNFIHLNCDPGLKKSVESLLIVDLAWRELCAIGIPQIPIVGKLQWRPTGSEVYLDAGIIDWSLKGAIDPSDCQELPVDAPFVDIRITPDVVTAIQRQDDSCTEIYGCVIEIKGIKNRSSNSMSPRPSVGSP